MTKSNKVKKVPKQKGKNKAKSTVKASKVKKETIKKVKVEEKPKAIKASKAKKEKTKKTQVEKKPRATKATVSPSEKKKKKTNVDKAKLVTPPRKTKNNATKKREDDIEVFEVLETDFTTLEGLAKAVNLTCKKEIRAKFDGTSDPLGMIKAVLGTQQPSKCRSMYISLVMQLTKGGTEEFIAASNKVDNLGRNVGDKVAQMIWDLVKDRYDVNDKPLAGNHDDEEMDDDTDENEEVVEEENVDSDEDNESNEDEEDDEDNDEEDDEDDEEEDDDNEEEYEDEAKQDTDEEEQQLSDDEDDIDSTKTKEESSDNSSSDNNSDHSDGEESVQSKKHSVGINASNKKETPVKKSGKSNVANGKRQIKGNDGNGEQDKKTKSNNGSKKNSKRGNLKDDKEYVKNTIESTDPETDPLNINLMTPDKMAQVAKKTNPDDCLIIVSKPIKVRGEKKKFVSVMVVTLIGRLWFLRYQFIIFILDAWMSSSKNPFNINNDDSEYDWIQTIGEAERRVEYSNTNERKTGVKGGRTNAMYLVVNGKNLNAIKDTVNNIRQIFSSLFKIYDNKSSRGEKYLEFLTTDMSAFGSLRERILNQHHGDETQAADMLTTQLAEAFHNPGPRIEFNQTLDRFLRNGEIRHILTRYANINQWDDAEESDKAACYRRIESIPDWRKMC